MTGATPTADEVEAGVISKNPNYVKGNANFSDLTTTSAEVEGKTLYDGSLQVTFTKKRSNLNAYYIIIKNNIRNCC